MGGGCENTLSPNQKFAPHDCGGKPTGGRISPIPTGLRNKAQGCEERATLGQSSMSSSTPMGLRHIAVPQPQPRWGCADSGRLTQGSSFLATLGFGPESLWDSTEE